MFGHEIGVDGVVLVKFGHARSDPLDVAGAFLPENQWKLGHLG